MPPSILLLVFTKVKNWDHCANVTLPDSTSVTIRVVKTAATLIASVDGQDDSPLEAGDEVEVRRSPRDVPVIHLPDYDAYAVLSRKLGWGGR